MLIEINFKSGKPTYLQIIEQIKYASAMGAVRVGDILPSIRALAEQLRINRNTVAKAYALLQQEGVVEMVQGKGVFFTDNDSPYTEKIRSAILVEAIDGAIVQAHHFQINKDKFLDLFNKRFDAFEKRRKKANER